MGNLGDFTPKIEQRTDTFSWFGVEYRVGPSTSSLMLTDWLAEAADIDPEKDQVKAIKSTAGMLRRIVHKDDFTAFWDVCLDRGVEVHHLLELINQIVGRKANRPTRRRSGSRPGRRDTALRSAAASSAPSARPTGTAPGQPVMTVMKRLERQGRSDLAMAVVATERARRAEAGTAG
jgi:hypothetical protein